MCDACEFPGQTGVAPRPRRLKIWEISGRHHCTIIGTCLSMRELWKLARKARVRFPDDMSDYDLHGAVVSAASSRDPLGHLIHRMLDRKYRNTLDRSKKIKSVALLAEFWSASLKSGDIPGPLWAVMSHGMTDHALREKVFGDVHMLSHLVGASNRADIKQLNAQEDALEALAGELESEKARTRQAIEDRDRQIETLKMELAAQTGEVRRAAMLQSRLEQFESGETVSRLSGRNRELNEELKIQRFEMETAQEAIKNIKRRNARLIGEADKANSQISALRAERDSLERVLEQKLINLCRQCDRPAATAANTHINLDGARVVYVGGRTSHISHIRQLVEHANGEFHHHDGGLEDSDGRLECVLGRGDVVMCPIDCVSHSACLKAKKYCKHTGKAFIPLRSSGLSSFTAGLRKLVSENGTGLTEVSHTP